MGIKILMPILESVIMVDDCDSRSELEIVDRLKGNECKGMTKVFEQIVKLPTDLPNIKGTVLVHAEVEKAGRVACKQKIKIHAN